MAARKILLHGGGILRFSEQSAVELLKDCSSFLFVPYAKPGESNQKEYTNVMRNALAKKRFDIGGIDESSDPQEAIEKAEALVVGGGNTFLLLKTLYEKNLIELIREKVNKGLPYLGASAGANVAGETIKTTNDMPITYPPSFNAIGLVPFVISPHFTTGASSPMGESRQKRIEEYLVLNETPVLCLQEGTVIYIEGEGKATLAGEGGATIFSKNAEPKEYALGSDLSFLLRKR